MVNVVRLPVVRAEECLYMTPRGHDGFRVDSSTLINKANAVIDAAVRVTLRIEILERYPVITDDCSARLDSCICNGLHSVSGSVRNENEKRFTTLVLNTATHCPLYRVAPMIFAPTELAVVDLDGFVRTADLLRAALHVHQQVLQSGPQSAVVLGVKRCASFDKLGR